jgi:hypothetical protein
MGWFSDFYKQNSSNEDMIYRGYKTIVSNNLQTKLTGVNKMMNIDSMNMEESLMSAGFIPSMFYIFQYTPVEVTTINDIDFFDYVPLMLCTSNKDNVICGVNFNILPQDVRAFLLDVIYDSNPSFYGEQLRSALRSNKPIINTELGNVLINKESFVSFANLIKVKSGVDITPAFRSYEIKNIKYARMIEYSDWKYIPLFNFNSSIRDAELKYVQESFYSSH